MSQYRQHYFDSNTRRFPRTLQQAFGPYTGHEIHDSRSGPLWTPVRVAFALTYVLAFIVLWWVI